jgi:hypothetical protein
MGYLTALFGLTPGDPVIYPVSVFKVFRDYVATHGIVSVNGSGITEDFTLMQNYPNPFNPVTNINYQLPIQNFVTLKVYDLLGREVTVLVNDWKEAGEHSVKFDGSGLASGVYFYRFQSGAFVETKKLLLLR